MSEHGATSAMKQLAPLIGEWRMRPEFDGMPQPDDGAPVVFDWMTGEQFLIERWEVPVPEAPDGLAVIGPDPETPGQYLQHYFDSRGVARVYRMSFADGVWRLWRDAPDFSPLDFSQRYSGTFSEDGNTITGQWEISHDGTTWELDFKLTYTRVG